MRFSSAQIVRIIVARRGISNSGIKASTAKLYERLLFIAAR